MFIAIYILSATLVYLRIKKSQLKKKLCEYLNINTSEDLIDYLIIFCPLYNTFCAIVILFEISYKGLTKKKNEKNT